MHYYYGHGASVVNEVIRIHVVTTSICHVVFAIYSNTLYSTEVVVAVAHALYHTARASDTAP